MPIYIVYHFVISSLDSIIKKAEARGETYILDLYTSEVESEEDMSEDEDAEEDVETAETSEALFTAIKAVYLAFVDDMKSPPNKGYVRMLMM